MKRKFDFIQFHEFFHGIDMTFNVETNPGTPKELLDIPTNQKFGNLESTQLWDWVPLVSHDGLYHGTGDWCVYLLL